MSDGKNIGKMMPNTNPTKKEVRVAVGVIWDDCGNIFIAKRQQGQHLQGLWEFPGGKVEKGESTVEALKRELKEEIGISILQSEPLIVIRHEYPEKTVVLDVHHVLAFEGSARGVEGQEVRWIAKKELSNYQFPEANVAIVKALKLPQKVAITGEYVDEKDFMAKLYSLINRGVTDVQIRAPYLSKNEYPAFFERVQKQLESDSAIRHEEINLYANCSPEQHDSIKDAHFHLPSRFLEGLASSGWQNKSHAWLSASCHSEEELKWAEAIGVDFVYFSPVMKTSSHPDQEAAGWEALERFCALSKVPVYALGGLKEEHIVTAIKRGAQGIAAIGAFWSEKCECEASKA